MPLTPLHWSWENQFAQFLSLSAVFQITGIWFTYSVLSNPHVGVNAKAHSQLTRDSMIQVQMLQI